MWPHLNDAPLFECYFKQYFLNYILCYPPYPFVFIPPFSSVWYIDCLFLFSPASTLNSLIFAIYNTCNYFNWYMLHPVLADWLSFYFLGLLLTLGHAENSYLAVCGFSVI